jgi:ParB-like nuclease domain
MSLQSMFTTAAAPSGAPALDARADFARARRAQRWALVMGRLRRTPRQLPSLPTVAVSPARPARLQCLPLDRIVGAVEASPHFDVAFRPASAHLRPRWERVAVAARCGVPLPPITVRHAPDGFYVVDGRHRVSVARFAGWHDIEAWVS